MSMKLINLTAILVMTIQAPCLYAEGGDPARGKMLAEKDCADCHGDDGLGDYDRPPIAGMNPQKHLKELMDYKTGKRIDENDDMDVAELSKQDMVDLAAYYATLPSPAKKK
ncbi:MAG: c-type cytochrome [Candidatus Thiodiazotropha sp. (ex Notomyrtea botanica)]|nr:c-type cytochrome [Candidatus Thiodiazotropha sp. (ex Notomyrtea botanica)]